MKDIEQMVETILTEKAVDAKAAADRMDKVLVAINNLRKITRPDKGFDKSVRKLEDDAKRIAIELNKML
jgi:hypothetical protein